MGLKDFFNSFSTKMTTAIMQQGFSDVSWSSTNKAAYIAEGYQINNIGFRCVDIITKAFAKTDLCVFTKDGQKIDDFNHPLIKLLNRPNADKGGAEFWQNVSAFRLITGEAYVEAIKGATGTVTELDYYMPTCMQVVEPKIGFLPVGYVYKKNEYKKYWEVDQNTGRCDILSWHTFNPNSKFRGMSTFESCARSVDQNNLANEWNMKMLQNDTQPSGILTTKGNLTPPQIEDLKEELKDKYSGTKNSKKPMVLHGGLEWQQMSLSPREMDWLQAKKVTAADIAMCFGVPPQLLGIEGSLTYANYAEARLALWDEAVIPLLDSFCDELNNWLVPLMGFEDLEIRYDLSQVPALEIRRMEQWDRVANANWISTNEKRERTGFDIRDGQEYDDILINAGLIPIGTDILAEPTEDTEQELIKAYVQSGLSEKKAKQHVELIMKNYVNHQC